MRNLSWLVAVAAVAVLGWFVFAPGESVPTSGEAPAPVEDVTTESETEDTANTESTDVEQAVEEVETTVIDAREAAEETVETVKDAAEEAVEDAVGDLKDAMKDAEKSLKNELENALGVTDEPAAEPVPDGDGTSIESTAETAEVEAVSLEDALTVEGFDSDVLLSAVAESDLNLLKKGAAEALIKSAQKNPELIQSVVDQLRKEFGL